MFWINRFKYVFNPQLLAKDLNCGSISILDPGQAIKQRRKYRDAIPTTNIDIERDSVYSFVTAPVPTEVSEVTAGDTAASGPETEEMEMDEQELALHCAAPKKTARQKTREETGRNRRRGGKNKAYYEKWAYTKDKRKHQSY